MVKIYSRVFVIATTRKTAWYWNLHHSKAWTFKLKVKKKTTGRLAASTNIITKIQHPRAQHNAYFTTYCRTPQLQEQAESTLQHSFPPHTPALYPHQAKFPTQLPSLPSPLPRDTNKDEIHENEIYEDEILSGSRALKPLPQTSRNQHFHFRRSRELCGQGKRVTSGLEAGRLGRVCCHVCTHTLELPLQLPWRQLLTWQQNYSQSSITVLHNAHKSFSMKYLYSRWTADEQVQYAHQCQLMHSITIQLKHTIVINGVLIGFPNAIKEAP